MIVNNLPPVGKSSKNEREQAMWRFAIRHGQVPLPADESRIGGESFNLQAGKFQFAHLPASALVGLAITIKRALPPGRALCARKERQLWRIPIARHESLEIVAVPGILLIVERPFDGRSDTGRVGVLALTTDRNQKSDEGKQQQLSTHDRLRVALQCRTSEDFPRLASKERTRTWDTFASFTFNLRAAAEWFRAIGSPPFKTKAVTVAGNTPRTRPSYSLVPK